MDNDLSIQTRRLVAINRALEQFVDEMGIGTILAMVSTILSEQEDDGT